jgi:tetratricopeptide (TPR) repeat protein
MGASAAGAGVTRRSPILRLRGGARPAKKAVMPDAATMQRLEGLFRRGELEAARREAEEALAQDPRSPPLLHLLGVVCCCAGDYAAGAPPLRELTSLQPGNLRARIDLINALIALGDLDEALALSKGTGPELARMRGYVLQCRGEFAEAADCYGAIVATQPRDFEIWNNLGTARRSAGDVQGSIAALARARNLRPDLAPIHLNLAASLAQSGRADEAAESYGAALRLEPGNAPARLDLARLLLAAQRMEEAEALYRELLGADPGASHVYLELGILLERANRIDDLEALLAQADAAIGRVPELTYLRAVALRRRGRREEALELAQAAPADVEPVRRTFLIGKLADGLGRTDEAFAAFEEMNRLTVESAATAGDPARYREHVRALTTLLAPGWHRSWTPAMPEAAREPPIFVVGFPRSGTTLLDTLLMGHGALQVLEEEPILQRCADALGDFSRLPSLDEKEIAALRDLYWQGVDAIAPGAGGKRVVDKLPLNILGTPLIHRLFPAAPIVFAARHPCDVVLSGFMQDFEINDAMANFLNLSDAAALYDLVLGFWAASQDALPLDVHTVSYERLVADPEAELRPLLAFLGLPWEARLLDHRRTARERGTISTPSYAQVVEPLYAEASGRWLRYRSHMAAVLPLLLPWAERLGYARPETVAPG